MNHDDVQNTRGISSDQISKLPEYSSPKTLFTFLISSIRNYHNNFAYIYNEDGKEVRVTYANLFEDVLLMARAFRKCGVCRGDKVMLLSDNRYSWIVTDLALMSFGAVNVPRGSDTPTQELEHIITHSESSYFIVETDKLLKRHSGFINSCKQLKSIFVMARQENHSLPPIALSYDELIKCSPWNQSDIDDFITMGEQLEPHDLLTIIYTSGTTGMPKGVQLSHGNVMHNIEEIPGLINLSEKDSWLSILPSWHIFERTAEYVALARGTTLVYSSVKTFSQDLEKYKPTLVATVPRVWESLYGKVQIGIRKKGEFAHQIFNGLVWVSAAFKRNRRKVLGRLPEFQQKPIFTRVSSRTLASIKMVMLAPLYAIATSKLGPVQERFGGRLRLAISGGGTLATYLEEWIDSVGIRIVNAYGMTECSPAIAGRGLNCRTYGTLGPPVPRTDLRIISDQGTTLPAGGEGQIEVRGEQVTKGYYNDEEENRKSFTPDGFFKTGDLGKMTVTGELVITGRAKEIIVLSNGENIDPTKIENALTMFPFIEDAILVGQDKKALGALLIPNREELKSYLSEKMSDFKKESKDFLTDVKVLNRICTDMNRILKPNQGFKPHEKLQGVLFLEREFALGEELTNTLKKKRHVIEKNYRKLINDLLQ